MQKTLLVIIGPTAVGKTALSIELAKRLGTEIVSGDSRQFYQEMSIGTAKPTEEELAMVPHHFINNRSIKEYYSAGDFEKEALEKIEELFLSHDFVVAIGGSGLYMKALCEGLDEVPPVDMVLRNELISAYQNQGLGYLQERMLSLNPEKLKKMDSNNPQRLMRAIELEMQGGLVVKKAKARPFKVVKIGLNMQRELLYERINQRVDVMMNMGLLNEVNALLPYREVNAMQTVGYSELVEHIDGLMTLEQAVDKIKQHTRNYAKRQMTWFRADEGIHWFEPNKTDDIELFVKTEAAKKSS